MVCGSWRVAIATAALPVAGLAALGTHTAVATCSMSSGTQVLRFDPSLQTTHQCMTFGCGRSASGGHRTCCSRCGLSGGHIHSARCHRMMSAGGAQQPMASASRSSTVTAGSGPLAPAHPPATTASAPAGSEPSSTATTDPGTQSVLSLGTTDGSLEDAHAWNSSAVAHSGQNHYEPLELDELD